MQLAFYIVFMNNTPLAVNVKIAYLSDLFVELVGCFVGFCHHLPLSDKNSDLYNESI